MGYPSNFKVVTRLLTENTLLASSAFTRFDKVNFGNRMAVFKIISTTDSLPKIILWSPLPYTPQVIDILKNFTGVSTEADLQVNYVIVPDREHNLAAGVYKEKFPLAKIIGPENTQNIPLDIEFTKELGHKVISGTALKQLVDDDLIVENFDFVYLPYHANSELVVYHKPSKTLFEADLLFNLGVDGKLEQFSPETGYPENFNPHQGWSFATRYLQPNSKVGKFLFNRLVNRAKSQPGLNAINTLDFKNIVMCHGNIITENAKQAFENVFIK
ncbi:hypothetical protein KGF56_000950 [Candida oxycetoniae]|uniref:Uncharacterized protein n=1 Tax=Candida oxycetoniae TaxID=497107 RepID=A0AAI9T018_9ASCO|nr:uncharacterized protein KGF56_000950 [Candida oxycetoniae]KAI3406109.2 hypothetical protein KGF56_000950 [Candida oxycetoniae]